jgi:hypothetical protein
MVNITFDLRCLNLLWFIRVHSPSN